MFVVIDIRASFVPSGLEFNWAWFQTLACLANFRRRFATPNKLQKPICFSLQPLAFSI
jgi:hypothetical protein